MIADSQGVRIAWESHGDGPPLLLVQGLGYGRWGWQPIVPLLAAAFPRARLRQPRHRRQRQAAGAVHGRADGR